MRICLITDAPGHPLLAAATEILTPRHQVETVDPDAGASPGRALPDLPDLPDLSDLVGPGALADVCLLKSHTPGALALAACLEERGIPVLNSAASTALCQDRTEMAALALRAGLPFAPTRTVATLAQLAAEEPATPLVIKSRHSRRRDLVTRTDGIACVRELAMMWPNEPVVVQEFTPNSGWDHKLWAIEGRLFAALRRSELSPDGRGPTLPLPIRDLPQGWADLVLRVGEVFALDVYGVDILDAGGGVPLIVDINAFPGIRGQAGAPEALAELAVRVGSGR